MVRNRGQLLLIGAILIGMVIVGTVVMLNTMQYADTAGAQSEYRLLDDAERTEEMVVRDMERLVVQVFNSNPSDPEQALRENISTYGNYSRNMTVSSGDASVNTTLNVSASKGQEIHHSSSTNLKSDGSDRNWELVRDTEELRQFEMTIEPKNVGGTFTVRISPDTGTDWVLTASKPTPNQVEVEVSHGPNSDSCREFDSEVELNLLRGTGRFPTAGTSCDSLSGLQDSVSTPYSIAFENGQHARGEYTLLVAGDIQESDIPGSTNSVPIIPAIDYQYRSPDLEYNRTILIETGDSS